MASTSSTSTVNEINTIITTTTATVVDPNPIPPTDPNAAISTITVIPSTDTKGKGTAEPETITTENSGLATTVKASSSDSSDTNCNGVVAEAAKKVARCIGRRNRGVSWGYDMEQGNRSTMEDALGIFPEFMQLCCKDFGGCTAPECKYALEKSPVHFFGLFDGHGGDQVTISHFLTHQNFFFSFC
ncbi:phosphatase 2C (PP2C)-like protein [Corchorus olitorius]|uniref:Phosphatase 2C (PP2C)-like protein n=1 Tax=Corchorus olitorius TaxID=93759 RepID=A0A1R3H855_9ROSI|nr:phosphatase 2C (PP2C)-like protein [Corchorus olitorius]